MHTTDIVAGTPRWALATVSLMTVAALTACGSSAGSSSTSAAKSNAATSGSSSPTASMTPKGPISSAAMYTKLKAGASSITSAHLTMSVKLGQQTYLTAQGDETLADGKVTAMSLNEQAGSINIRMLLVDGCLYLKLPSNLNETGKPWHKATSSSTNPVLRQLSTSMSSMTQSGSPTEYAAFASYGSLKTVGIEQVNGVTTTHVSLMVDVTKIHSAAFTPAIKQALAKAGVTKIPIELWVDEQGRPVKASEKLTVEGQVMSTNVTMTQLNQPVSITAPPASQVSSS